MSQPTDQDYERALQALGRDAKGTLLAAAKRNLNTAQQVRDLLVSMDFLEVSEEIRGTLSFFQEDAVHAANEAQAQLEVLRGLFGVSL